MKNWMQYAANEIARQHVELGRMNRVDVPSIIARHAPFEPDVAYMPVPRCDECKHWRPEGTCTVEGTEHRYGSCQLTEEHLAKFSAEAGFATVQTEDDFGCVQFEEKK